MDKRKEFKNRIIAFGATALVAIGAGPVANAISNENDLSKYDIKNEQYMNYINGSESKKIKEMQELEDSIKKYEELRLKKILNKEEKEEFEQTKNFIKQEMRSGNVSEIYLNNLLKEKLKQAYNVKDIETRYWSDEEIRIDLYKENGQCEHMKEEDKVKPIKIAMKDIATLQGYKDKEEFSKLDIDNFIKIQKNMKGFANLKFIKASDKPLAYAQINLEKDDELEK